MSRDLESAGVIKNAALFSLYARVQGFASKMKVGEYALHTQMTPAEVLAVLVSGKSIGYSFTISEGLNIFEIAQILEKTGKITAEEFLKQTQNPALAKELLGEELASLEGYLFPETYQYTKFTTFKEILAAMVARFKQNYEQVESAAERLGWSRHQTVTFASIIEKETGAPEERPLISSVFHNRLLKGMMLQTDPTVLYAKMRRSQRYELSITKADLQWPDDYNTYTKKGLPPGPISNPGLAALRAATAPTPSDYLFFVSKNDGTHVFTREYKDHQQAVQKTQLNPKAREGKSWRDLKKRAGTPPQSKSQIKR